VALRTLTGADLTNQVVFLRVDANVPLDGATIADDGRIRAFLPTLQWLVDAGARIILASHLGRPEGSHDSAFSMAPVAKRVEELIGQPVALVDAVSGKQVWERLNTLSPGQAMMIENVRFDARETSKNADERMSLAREWATHIDAVVSDGFGVVHRAQASVYELPSITPSYAGFLVEKEVDVVTKLTRNPVAPYTVVLGGSKVSDKLGVIDALLPHADTIVIGGGMVFTVLHQQGHAVGSSLLEKDMLATVAAFLEKATKLGVSIVLPTDIVMAESFAPDATWQVLPVDSLETGPAGANAIGLDIGPASAKHFQEVIQESHTVFWNGPMGVFEFETFSAGTHAVAEGLTRVDGLSVVGGGDSAAAVRALGFDDSQFGHISTGGGASLEFLEGKLLPGLEILGWNP